MSKSLDEWINFDSLNRVSSIHTGIVKFKSLDKELVVDGKLFSSTIFDDAFYLIALDNEVITIEAMNHQLGFIKNIQKNEVSQAKKMRIELLTFRNEKQDGSISSQSLIKEYLIIDAVPVEIAITQKGLFNNEKFQFVKKHYNL